MPDTNTLILIGSLSLFFTVLTAAIIAADKVVNLQKEANLRLNPNGYHWQFFRLTSLPEQEPARQRKLGDLGFEKGMLQGAALDGRLAALLGLWLLIRWTAYPKAKKRALRAIAHANSGDREVVGALAQLLK